MTARPAGDIVHGMDLADYAATDEKRDPSASRRDGEAKLRQSRGIEVGHIFYFGTKYSDADGA